MNDFKPFEKLWTTTSDWLRWTDGWFNDPLTSIDSEPLDRLVTEALQTMSGLIKQFEGNIGWQLICYLRKSSNSKKKVTNLSDLFIFLFVCSCSGMVCSPTQY